MAKKAEWENYTKEMVIADVAKSYNKVDFRARFPNSYRAARNKGWYDEVTEPLVKVKDDRGRIIYAFEFPDKSVYVGLTVVEKRRYNSHIFGNSPVALHSILTSKEPTYKIIASNLSPEESREMEACTVEKYKIDGWKILNKYATGSLGKCRNFWTKELVKKIADKYEKRIDFKNKDNNAYQAAQKYGWLDNVTSHMDYVDRTIWTYEKTKDFAKKFKTRSEFKRGNYQAWANSWKNGWLDEFFPIKLKNQFDNRL
jgi:hypothetical protein